MFEDQRIWLFFSLELRFCVRLKSSTVNKISANTFQQIGNSSRTEGYVMQPVAK